MDDFVPLQYDDSLTPLGRDYMSGHLANLGTLAEIISEYGEEEMDKEN